MRIPSAFLLMALSVGGCAGNPNSLRNFSDIDGSWVAIVVSSDCAIAQTFPINIAGNAFGVRIPQTNIFFSGVVRDGVVRTKQQSLEGKGPTSAEVSEIEVVFDGVDRAHGTWRSSRCSGAVNLNRQGAS